MAALERIRKTNPDLIVLNGDVTDNGAAEDITLARQTLEQGGCQLIPLTSTIGSRRHAGADRRQDPVLLRPGQPRVLPRRRPGRPRAVHRRVRPALRHVRPQRHALHPARLVLRHAAQHVLGAAADVPGGARRRARPTRRSRTSWSSPTTRWTTRPRPTPPSSATAPRSRWSRSCSPTSATHSDKGVVDGRLARADRRRAPHRGRPLHGAARPRARTRTARRTAAASPAGWTGVSTRTRPPASSG